MGKRKNNTLVRRTGLRAYRPVCWVSAEGATERDYFRMVVFKDARASVKYPKNVHPSRILRQFSRGSKRRLGPGGLDMETRRGSLWT